MNPIAVLLVALLGALLGGRGCNPSDAPPPMLACPAEGCADGLPCVPNETGARVCCPYHPHPVGPLLNVCSFNPCGNPDGPSPAGSCACDAECPAFSADCRAPAVCELGRCVAAPAPPLTRCDHGAGVCGEEGECRACEANVECEAGNVAECSARVCAPDGRCTAAPLPVGSPCNFREGGHCAADGSCTG